MGLGGSRELHSEQASPYTSIIGIIKSSRIRQEGHVASKERNRMYTRFWWEYHKKSEQYEDLDIGGKIILKLRISVFCEIKPCTLFLKVSLHDVTSKQIELFITSAVSI